MYHRDMNRQELLALFREWQGAECYADEWAFTEAGLCGRLEAVGIDPIDPPSWLLEEA